MSSWPEQCRARELGINLSSKNSPLSPCHFKRNATTGTDFARRLLVSSTLSGHEEVVHALSWSSDGSLLVTGSEDCKAKVWDAVRSKPFASFETGHTSSIFCAKFMPGTGNEQIITASADKQVRVINIQRAAAKPYCSHRGRVRSVAPVTQFEFLSAGEDGTVRQFDSRDTPPSSRTYDWDGAYDRRTVLVDQKGEPGGKVAIYCLAVDPLRPHLIATGGSDPIVRVFDRRYLQCSLPHTSSHRSQWAFCMVPDHLVRTTRTTMFAGLPVTISRLHHITGISFSHSGQQLVASYAGEHIYSFDTTEHAQGYDSIAAAAHERNLQTSLSSAYRRGSVRASSTSGTISPRVAGSRRLGRDRQTAAGGSAVNSRWRDGAMFGAELGVAMHGQDARLGPAPTGQGVNDALLPHIPGPHPSSPPSPLPEPPTHTMRHVTFMTVTPHAVYSHPMPLQLPPDLLDAAATAEALAGGAAAVVAAAAATGGGTPGEAGSQAGSTAGPSDTSPTPPPLPRSPQALFTRSTTLHRPAFTTLRLRTPSIPSHPSSAMPPRAPPAPSHSATPSSHLGMTPPTALSPTGPPPSGAFHNMTARSVAAWPTATAPAGTPTPHPSVTTLAAAAAALEQSLSYISSSQESTRRLLSAQQQLQRSRQRNRVGGSSAGGGLPPPHPSPPGSQRTGSRSNGRSTPLFQGLGGGREAAPATSSLQRPAEGVPSVRPGSTGDSSGAGAEAQANKRRRLSLFPPRFASRSTTSTYPPAASSPAHPSPTRPSSATRVLSMIQSVAAMSQRYLGLSRPATSVVATPVHQPAAGAGSSATPARWPRPSSSDSDVDTDQPPLDRIQRRRPALFSSTFRDYPRPAARPFRDEPGESEPAAGLAAGSAQVLHTAAAGAGRAPVAAGGAVGAGVLAAALLQPLPAAGTFTAAAAEASQEMIASAKVSPPLPMSATDIAAPSNPPISLHHLFNPAPGSSPPGLAMQPHATSSCAPLTLSSPTQPSLLSEALSHPHPAPQPSTHAAPSTSGLTHASEDSTHAMVIDCGTAAVATDRHTHSLTQAHASASALAQPHPPSPLDPTHSRQPAPMRALSPPSPHSVAHHGPSVPYSPTSQHASLDISLVQSTATSTDVATAEPVHASARLLVPQPEAQAALIRPAPCAPSFHPLPHALPASTDDTASREAKHPGKRPHTGLSHGHDTSPSLSSVSGLPQSCTTGPTNRHHPNPSSGFPLNPAPTSSPHRHPLLSRSAFSPVPRQQPSQPSPAGRATHHPAQQASAVETQAHRPAGQLVTTGQGAGGATVAAGGIASGSGTAPASPLVSDPFFTQLVQTMLPLPRMMPEPTRRPGRPYSHSSSSSLSSPAHSTPSPAHAALISSPSDPYDLAADASSHPPTDQPPAALPAARASGAVTIAAAAAGGAGPAATPATAGNTATAAAAQANRRRHTSHTHVIIHLSTNFHPGDNPDSSDDDLGSGPDLQHYMDLDADLLPFGLRAVTAPARPPGTGGVFMATSLGLGLPGGTQWTSMGAAGGPNRMDHRAAAGRSGGSRRSGRGGGDRWQPQDSQDPAGLSGTGTIGAQGAPAGLGEGSQRRAGHGQEGSQADAGTDDGAEAAPDVASGPAARASSMSDIWCLVGGTRPVRSGQRAVQARQARAASWPREDPRLTDAAILVAREGLRRHSSQLVQSSQDGSSEQVRAAPSSGSPGSGTPWDGLSGSGAPGSGPSGSGTSGHGSLGKGALGCGAPGNGRLRLESESKLERTSAFVSGRDRPLGPGPGSRHAGAGPRQDAALGPDSGFLFGSEFGSFVAPGLAANPAAHTNSASAGHSAGAGDGCSAGAANGFSADADAAITEVVVEQRQGERDNTAEVSGPSACTAGALQHGREELGERGSRDLPSEQEDGERGLTLQHSRDRAESRQNAADLEIEEYEEERRRHRRRRVGPVMEEEDLSEEEPQQESRHYQQRFTGHKNQRFTKEGYKMEVSYLGPGSEYIMSGSDSGKIYIWQAGSGRLINILDTEDVVASCVQPHPVDLSLASSGHQPVVKLWQPIAAEPAPLPQLQDAAPQREEDNTLPRLNTLLSFMQVLGSGVGETTLELPLLPQAPGPNEDPAQNNNTGVVPRGGGGNTEGTTGECSIM